MSLDEPRVHAQLMLVISFSFSIAISNHVLSQNEQIFGVEFDSSLRHGVPNSRWIAVSTNNPILMTAPPSKTTHESNSVQKPAFFYAKPGPWGKLKCFYIYLEPAQNVVDRMRLPSKEICWTFRRNSETDLDAIFQKAKLPVGMREFLLDPKNQLEQADTISLFPTKGDIETMTPSMRETIYPFLADSPHGAYYSVPLLISTESVEEWFLQSNLRPEVIAKISQLSYRRGSLIAFSDVQLLMNEAESDAEAKSILKAMYRTRSLMVQIELSNEDNISDIIDYWGANTAHLRKDIEPLIQSVIDIKGVNVLGLTHLLPPLPRKLLYTFPGSDYAAKGGFPDCHWTSLNFFNFNSHDYLLDSKRLTNYVNEHFTPVKDTIQFGDVLFFVERQTGEFVHSCVYIADDLVFTKNGQNGTTPWVIMKLADLVKYYSCFAKQSDISTHVFRNK